MKVVYLEQIIGSFKARVFKQASIQEILSSVKYLLGHKYTDTHFWSWPLDIKNVNKHINYDKTTFIQDHAWLCSSSLTKGSGTLFA